MTSQALDSRGPRSFFLKSESVKILTGPIKIFIGPAKTLTGRVEILIGPVKIMTGRVNTLTGLVNI